MSFISNGPQIRVVYTGSTNTTTAYPSGNWQTVTIQPPPPTPIPPDPQDLLVEACILQAAQDMAKGAPVKPEEMVAVAKALLNMHRMMHLSRATLKNLLDAFESYTVTDK